ncbi:MAG TPA: hypothetical protein VFM18_15115, partial [Methanosarcina sp.]|nr:hypothetical protein [Methanosarcina sp.]
MTKQFDPKLVQSLTALRTLGSTFPGNPMADAGTNHIHPISAIVGLSDALSTLSSAITQLNSNLNSIDTRLTTAEAAITALQAGGATGQIPGNTVLPFISGVAAVGQTLSTTDGSWSGSPSYFTYQWKRAGVAITGATNNTYLVASADAGNALTVTVAATNASGTGIATSAATSSVISTPGNTALPVITGTPAIGQTLTTSNGTWTGSPTGYTYQWQRAGANISGATSSTYILVSADNTYAITCIVTATNASGSSSATSAAVTAVDIPSVLVIPAISGSPVNGNTVTAAPGTWTGSPTFTYQWKRGGSAITGATSQSYTLVLADVGASITVTVTATNIAGSASSTSSAVTGIAAGQTADVASNPVTTALTGLRTFNIGPGQTYPTPGDFTGWNSLQAGDVVNIFYSATPYQWKLGIRAQGTSINPVIINGVTDSSGNRPKFDFAGAATVPGMSVANGSGTLNIFGTDPTQFEVLCGFVIVSGKNDDYNTYKPKWIQVQNIEFTGARSGATFTASNGTTQTYGSASAIRLEACANVTISNCVCTDSGFGIFTKAALQDLNHCTENVIIRNCRVYGNGVSGSYFEHNFYVQSTSPIIEGNYIGQVRSGSQGSSYKARCSNEIFRYNYVEASARACDWVHSEESLQGVTASTGYGLCYAYGNTIVNDFNLPRGGASNPIHYGGDNEGEDHGTGTLIDPTTLTYPYRTQLYFFNNTVINKATVAQNYRTAIFQPSLVGVKIDAWSNIFVCQGTSNFAWVTEVGTVNLRGTNILNGTVTNATDYGVDATRYAINQLGTLTTTDASIVDITNGDYRINSGSPAIDASTTLPGGSTAATVQSTYPINYQPNLKTNGLVVRTVQGSALDLGSMEYGLGTGLPPAQPANTSLPVISGTPVNGNTLTTSNGSWSGSPTAYTYQWKRAGANISNATSNSYTLTTTDVGNTITVTVTASNSVGSASATSAGVNAVAANLPANTTAPAITGTAQSGQTVSCSSGTWTNTPSSYAYQWQRAGANISGATSSSYLLQSADVGQAITCIVTATNGNGSTSATSNTITPTAGALEPDVNGVFTFNEANGTSLNTINSKWARADGGAIEIEVQSNMAQSTAGSGYNGAAHVYVNSQAAEQSSKCKTGTGFTGAGAILAMYINHDGTNFYDAEITNTSWQIRSQAGWLNGASSGFTPNLTTTQRVFELKRVGTTLSLYMDGGLLGSA